MRFFPTKVCTFPPSGSFLPLLSLKRLLIGVTVSSYLMTDDPFWSLAFETVKVAIPLYNNSCYQLSFQIFLPFCKCKALKITTIVNSKTQVIVWIKISMMLPPSYSSRIIYSTYWCFHFFTDWVWDLLGQNIKAGSYNFFSKKYKIHGQYP